MWGCAAAVALLLDLGADRTITADGYSVQPLRNATPLQWAKVGAKEGWGDFNPSAGWGKHNEVIALLTETSEEG
jgi:hypothetical protein